MDNTSKFDGKADIYKKFRPGYPVEYMDYLTAACELRSGRMVADIGSGTGILTKLLLERSVQVMAVEPNTDMRATADCELVRYAGFVSVDATAEETGLPDASVDLITVAQAFQWFDPDRFQTECRRILKPGSLVALVWNTRVKTSPFVMETAVICRKYCPAFKGFSGGSEEITERMQRFFRDGVYEYKIFPHDLPYNREGFIGRMLSESSAPRDGDPNYQPFVDEMILLYKKFNINDRIIIPNLTKSYVGQV